MIRNHWIRKLKAKEVEGFAEVQLPDDSQQFFKPNEKDLQEELQSLPEPKHELAIDRFRRGEEAFAAKKYEEAAELYASSDTATASLIAQAAQGVACVLTSDLYSAEAVFSRSANLAAERGWEQFQGLLQINRAQVLQDMGDWTGANRCLEEATGVLKTEDEGHHVNFVKTRLALLCMHRGQYYQGLQLCDEGIYSITKRQDTVEAAASRALVKGGLLTAMGKFHDGETVLREALVQISRRRINVVGRLHLQLAYLWLLQGRNDASHHIDAAQELYESLDDAHAKGRVLGLRGLMHLSSGDMKNGGRYFAEAIDLEEHLRYRRGQVRSRLTWGRCLLRLGITAQAQELLAKALTLAQQSGLRPLALECEILLSMLSGGSDVEATILSLRRFVDQCYKMGLPTLEMQIGHYLSSVYTSQGHFEKAASCCQEVLHKSEQVGSRIDQGKALEALSQIATQEGRTNAAAEYKATAQAIFQSMGISHRLT